MRRRLAPLAAGFFLALIAGSVGGSPAHDGAAHSFYGTNVGGRTFNRPNVTSLTLSGKIVPYSSQPFFVDATATCAFDPSELRMSMK